MVTETKLENIDGTKSPETSEVTTFGVLFLSSVLFIVC